MKVAHDDAFRKLEYQPFSRELRLIQYRRNRIG